MGDLRDESDSDLIETLCVALRDVGVINEALPDWPVARKAVARVKTLSQALQERALPVDARLRRLSTECNWDMLQLWQDSIAFPDAVPYLAATPTPGCGNCGGNIPRSMPLRLCRACVEKGLAAIAAAEPSHVQNCTVCGKVGSGFLVYADGVEWMHYCKQCLEDGRRRYEAR